MVGARAQKNMDLGAARLRRSGINILANAVHPKYGLAWTDGRCVYLTQVRIKEEVVEREDSLKLGEFECVQSLHWSCDSCLVCYLCLVHEGMVTLWKVTGVSPELNLKQVRKINATPVPQGVLWNPDRDLVCILNRDRASFYFKHCQSKGSYALPPIESGKITCGCWSLDGKKLLIGIGSIILIYQWEDIAKSVSDYTLIAWKIPSVEGRLTTLAALSNTWMVCTVELPLELLCHSSNADMFRAPESAGDYSDSTSRLFNLQRNAMPAQRTAQMVMFEVPYSQKEPRKIAGVPLRSVVCPDLIHYNPSLRRVTVGSNSQPVMQVFQVTDTQLWKLQDIRLDMDERPKGLCGFASRGSSTPPEGVLVMVGSMAHSSDVAFLPTSNCTLYRLALTFQPFRNPDLAVLEKLVSRAGGESMNHLSLDSYTNDSIFKELQLPSSNVKVHLLRINPLRQDSNRSETSDGMQDGGSSPEASPTDSGPKQNVLPLNDEGLELLLPSSRAITMEARNPTGIIVMDSGVEESEAELEVEGVSFEDHMPNFVNALDKITNPTMLMLGCRETVSDCGSNSNPGHGNHKTPLAATSTWKGKQHRSIPSEASVSSENMSTTFTEPRMQRRASLESDPLSARDRFSPELPQQVAALETLLSTQGAQIVRINDRIDYIARLLEETSLVASTQYQSLSSPELLHVVLEPQDEGEVSVNKTFVLDNSRLQLEPVKQTFGLLTMEIIIDGVACVVGSNVDGYIPIKFTPNDTIHITGRPAIEQLSRSPFVVASTI